MITAGVECQKKDCIFLETIQDDKFHILCKARNKKYSYGQYVPCEDYKKKKEGGNKRWKSR